MSSTEFNPVQPRHCHSPVAYVRRPPVMYVCFLLLLTTTAAAEAIIIFAAKAAHDACGWSHARAYLIDASPLVAAKHRHIYRERDTHTDAMSAQDERGAAGLPPPPSSLVPRSSASQPAHPSIHPPTQPFLCVSCFMLSGPQKTQKPSPAPIWIAGYRFGPESTRLDCEALLPARPASQPCILRAIHSRRGRSQAPPTSLLYIDRHGAPYIHRHNEPTNLLLHPRKAMPSFNAAISLLCSSHRRSDRERRPSPKRIHHDAHISRHTSIMQRKQTGGRALGFLPSLSLSPF